MASQESPESSKREPLAPAARKRLQKCFEHAEKQASQENYDYASELFTQCVLGEPANPNYVQSFVGNLQKKYNNNKKGSPLAQFKERGARAALKKALTQNDWDEVIKNGITVLKVNPWDVPTLTGMATACAAIMAQVEGGMSAGFGECELYYLKCAFEAGPKDPEVCRQLAMALGRRQRFDEAIAFWHKVEQARPNDEEAQKAIATLAVEKTIAHGKWDESDGTKRLRTARPGAQAEEELTPEERLKRRVARAPKDISGYHELAQFYINADRFQDAVTVYNKALEVFDNDVDLREKVEDIQIRHLRTKLINAEKNYREVRTPAAKAEFEKLNQEILDKELELYKARCERYPNNLNFKYEVGLRFQLKGEYSEAIKEFQVARNEPRRKGVSLMHLGECFQSIKQFSLAMNHYEQAIQEIPDRDADNKKKALYRAGKLAYGLQEFDVAEKHLNILAALDFGYRDGEIPALLDKIQKKRNDK